MNTGMINRGAPRGVRPWRVGLALSALLCVGCETPKPVRTMEDLCREALEGSRVLNADPAQLAIDSRQSGDQVLAHDRAPLLPPQPPDDPDAPLVSDTF